MTYEIMLLNTDLVITAETQCQPMIDLFEDQCEPMFSDKRQDGLWHSSINARDSGVLGDPKHSPDHDIDCLLSVIEKSNAEIKAFLRDAQEFEFNVGWQAAEQRPEGAFSLSNELVQRLAALGATFTVTVYPSCENDIE